MTARMFSDREKLVAFLKWYSVIVLPVTAICAMQFMDSSLTGSLNRYAWQDPSGGEGNVAGFVDSTGTNYVRVTGTFSYISGLSVYLPVVFALLLGLISLKSTKQMPRALRLLLYVGIGSVTVAAFMTGSRGAVFPIALTMAFFYFFSPIKHLFKRFREVAVIGVVVYVCFSQAFPQAYDAFTTRAFGSDQEVNEGVGRILISFTLPAEEAKRAGALGYGIGLTQNAVPAISRLLGIQNPAERLPLNPEAEPGRIMMETGLMGFILYMLVRILVFATLLRVCLLIRDPESKAMAVAIFGVVILQLIMGGAIINHTQGVYQWALAGIPLGLLNAERLAARAIKFASPLANPHHRTSMASGMSAV